MQQTEQDGGRREEDLAAALARIKGRRVAVLCVGNRMRADDGFGPAVAEALSAHLRSPVFDGGQAPENELPRIARLSPEAVLVVDAVDFGAPAGTLAVLDPKRLREGGFDTHTASLSAAAEFLEASCGAEIILLACQPAILELGEAMSQAVEEAVRRAAGHLRAALGAN